MFSQQDLKQFEEKQISRDQIEIQLQNFENGFPYAKLQASATPVNGIRVLSQEEINEYILEFKSKTGNYRIIKMVPASGAASRMFKSLHAFMDSFDIEPEGDVKEFIERIRDFAFFEHLKESMQKDGHDLDSALEKKDHKRILRYLLTDDGLGYTSLPKGLLAFHSYSEERLM